MDNVEISIVIPVYKVEKYISRCLDSILNQTFQDFEIILVDDLSPDNSIKIAEKFAQKDSRIRILHNSENSGAAWSRMIGYNNARGKYIAFCDPDDYLPLNAYELLYQSIQEDPSIDICIGNYQRVFSDGTMSRVFRSYLKYGDDGYGFAKSTLLGETPQFLWNKLFRSSLLQEIEIITYKNFSKSSDEFLLFQLMKGIRKVKTIEDVVYYYNDNQESASYNKANPHAISAILTSQDYLEKLYNSDRELSKYVKTRKIYNYNKLIQVCANDKKQLKGLFDRNIDHLFMPWTLLRHVSRRTALNCFINYLKIKPKTII